MAVLALQASSVASAMADAFRLDLMSKLLLAMLAGGAIGFERQIAGKAAGLRTNILICVGSALFMDLSMNLGTTLGVERVGDPGRIAAQVVTGIGFIGAGTIMQARGSITGLTSAATIFVVAAIGLNVGAGFYREALGATAAVMLVLAGLGTLEHRLLRLRRSHAATIRTKRGTTLEWVRTALFAEGLEITKVDVFDHDNDRVFEMQLRGPSLQFDIARRGLLELEPVLNVILD
jgi:putative Mg2+ transporter-C (MgtC) family protein